MKPLTHLALTAAFALVPLGLYAAVAHEPLSQPHDIAAGITYSVEPLAPDEHGHGRLYLARIKLDPAQVQLFLTPPAPDAPTTGEWTHRLTHTDHTARTNNLAVAINACTFAGGSWPICRPGQPARQIETTLVNGKPIFLWEHTYLLGFRPDLTPEPVGKPPPTDKFPTWQLALGSQSWAASDGHFNPGTGEGNIDARTFVAFNPTTRELFLAVFDHASYGRGSRELLARGATWATHLDGGDSSTFVVNGRPVFGNWRPVANHFGVVNIVAAPLRR